MRTAFGGGQRAEAFHLVEAFSNWYLPWELEFGRGWGLQTELAFSVGWLADPGADAAVLTLGPGLVLHRDGLPLSLEGGCTPTWITMHNFGTRSFGDDFQFTSYVGLNWDLSSRFRVGYRFQHMSNAGIGSPNPGLNLHAVAVSYLF